MSLLRLLDVSGIFHPLWRYHESRGSSPGDAATDTVRALRERASAAGADYIVACCDSGKCFRHDIAMEYRAADPTYRGYKGNRKEKDAAMMAALDRVIDNLEQDGVPIFRVPGFEADDVIAALVAWAVPQGFDVEIVSDDKDLVALVSPPMTLSDAHHGGVSVVKRSGEVVGPEEVKATFGVEPYQIPEYLALVGDVSDHVKGIPGIGETKASAMLSAYGTWTAIVEAAKKDADYVAECECQLALAREKRVRPLPTFDKPKFQNATRAAILASEAQFDISLRLTTLRRDVPLDFAQVTAPRVPKPKPPSAAWQERSAKLAAMPAEDDFAADAADAFNESGEQEDIMPELQSQQTIVANDPPSSAEVPIIVEQSTGIVPAGIEPKTTGVMTPRKELSGPDNFMRFALEPRNYMEARAAAEDAADSKLYKGIETPAQALQVILKGRKYGLTVADSLQMIHMIEGKPCLSAQLILGLVMSSRIAEYMDFIESEDTHAVWETKRRGRNIIKRWRFSVDDAKRAKLGGSGKGGDFDPNSNWAKFPRVMCLWRAGVFLSRAVYPDLVGGLYMPDELGGTEPEIDASTPAHGLVIPVAA